MALTQAQIEAQLDKFFDSLKDNVASSIGNALPLIGKLADLPGGADALDPFAALKKKVTDAIEGASGPDVAQSVADAIKALGVNGLSATKTAGGGLDITFDPDEVTVNTGTAKLDVGSGIGSFLSLPVQTSASFKAKLDTGVSFASDGTFSLKDTGAPDLSVEIDGDLSLGTKADPISADLGVVKVDVNDADATKPELQAKASIDLSTGTGGAIKATTTLDGSAGLDLDFKTDKVLFGLLPNISGELVINFPTSGGSFGSPTISVKNVTLDLKSYLGILGKTFSGVGKLFNEGALGTIVDILTDPVPALDGLAHTFGLLGALDTIGLPTASDGHDGKVTIPDLVVAANSSLGPEIEPFYDAVQIIDIIRKLSDPLPNADDPTINFGGGSLVGGTPVSNADPTAIVDKLQDELGKLGLPKDVTDFLGDIVPSATSLGTLSPAAVGSSSGFTFGLFDHPEEILDLLFTKKPVDLVKYDVPPLSFDQGFSYFFPVLGPLGFFLTGNIDAKLDVDVGYDTTSLLPGKNFYDGFYLSTAPDGLPGDNTGPSRTRHSDGTNEVNGAPVFAPTGSVFPYEPAGYLNVKLGGAAGVDIVIGSAGVGADIGFDLDAYFRNQKFRPGSENFGCAFDVNGRAYVDVHVFVEVGFGPFSVEKDIPLAEATLADFDLFKCVPPTVVPTEAAPGLATPDGTDLLLNVGDRADKRLVADDEGGTPHKLVDPRDPNLEGYVIARARTNPDPDAIMPTAPGDPIPNALDVTAFGFTQRVDTTTLNLIKANFEDGNDFLVIQTDVTTDSDVSAGNGDDELAGGAGRDNLRGDAGNDDLRGNDGNDSLTGGAGNDQLLGGKGADTLDGGADSDTVDYSTANRDVKVGVTILQFDNGYSASYGGEAEGDKLISIENITGTDFNDIILSTINQEQDLDGGAGDDVLEGGAGKDFLLGGAGGDYLEGNGGENGTSYITSQLAVDVDLNRSVQSGGDAEGDRLFDIQDIGGSIFNDRLTGNGDRNVIDGGAGNDTLAGGGGKDSVSGGDGDDLIDGGADGDTVNGGSGLNTLSYERVGGSVSVDLGTGAGPDAVVMALANPYGTGRGFSTFANLIGSGSNDALSGDLGYNRIEGRGGNDLVNGDGGNDTLVGGAGADTLVGGDGEDLVDYSGSTAAVSVNLSNTGTGGEAAGDHYRADGSSIDTDEDLLGSRFGDVLIGNSLDNTIDPDISRNVANESVSGRGGTDTLHANYSTTESDQGGGIDGGFAPNSTSSGFIQRLTSDRSGVLDQVNFDTVERLEVTGTLKADRIFGGALDDQIYSGSGNDTVIGGLGADDIRTGAGNDLVYEGTGADRQASSFGTDASPFLLDGGDGIDTLSISLAASTRDITLSGAPNGAEFHGINFESASGAAAENFEILGNVTTGSGNDAVTQFGVHNNTISTGNGDDLITPGLGFDTVDGGLDTTGLVFNPATGQYELGTVRDGEFSFYDYDTFAKAKGDRLVLDYSSLATGQVVDSDVRPVQYDLRYTVYGQSSFLLTSGGSYFTRSATRASSRHTNEVDFSNIEGVTITGSRGNDRLVGTLAASGDVGSPFQQVRGGADILRGGAGDDILIGAANFPNGNASVAGGVDGDDMLFGGAGDDILVGADIYDASSYPYYTQAGPNEVDTLTGGTGHDTFVLGTESGSLYNYYSNGKFGDHNRAIITDFSKTDDIIQLSDRFSYFTQESNGNTYIYFDPKLSVSGQDVIAELDGVTGFDLRASYVDYVGNGKPGVDLSAPLPAKKTVGVQKAVSADTSGDDVSPAAAQAVPSLLPAFSVKQDSKPADILAALGGRPGDSVTLDGSAEAFGTFKDDPFHLGSGVILSTGRVADLPGKNTVASGAATPADKPLAFEKVTTASGNTLYRADVTGLDIGSITLRDSNTKVGGNTGAASGFDIDAVVFSNKLITSTSSSVDFNNATTLPRLDVLDYSNASLHFTPGTQRPLAPGGIATAPNLIGSVNDTLVDNGFAQLETFTPNGNDSALVLGDGGSLGLDLKTPIKAGGPTYLYVGEVGTLGPDESLSAVISASPAPIVPVGDLSTDLGAAGPNGDDTKLTYRFTPKAGDTTFSFDAVLFSEEFPEFNGSTATDLFNITLNGIDIGALSNGTAITVQNLAGNASGDLIRNDPGTGPLADTIKADAYTKTLTVTGPLLQGQQNVLTVEVKDGRDAYLDSGILIKGNSLQTYATPAITATGGGTIVEEGSPDTVTLAASGAPLTAPVMIMVTPTANLDIGAGGGKPVIVTLKPGTTTTDLSVHALDGDPNLPGVLTYQVASTQTGLNGFALAPTLFDLEAGTGATNHAPVITPPAGIIDVAENTTPVATVAATDPDPGQTLTYAIAGGADAALFTVDPHTGLLAFGTAPDFENPQDAGHDNLYDVVVRASDNGIPSLSDNQAYKVQVTDVDEGPGAGNGTTRLSASFVSESASFHDTFGWYDTVTGRGGVLFSSIEAQGKYPNVAPGTEHSFAVATADLSHIQFFLVPDGGDLAPVSDEAPDAPVLVTRLADGAWGVELLNGDGSVKTGPDGKPVVLAGRGADALFTEVARNAGGVDYASSTVGAVQSAATLAGDTLDGPTGTVAWEDLAARKLANGTYTKPGDADYNDVVFSVSAAAGVTRNGTAEADTLAGGAGDDVLSGAGGDDALSGLAGKDRIEGGGGDDNLLGGAGADTFVFLQGFGHDTIGDFQATGPGHDVLQLQKSIFPAYATVADLAAGAALTQSGQDVVLSAGADTITLQHQTLAALRADTAWATFA